MDSFGHIKRFISGKKGPASTRPFLLGSRSSKAFILATVCIAIFNDILVYAIILPVVPYSIIERAAVAEASVQKWLTILSAAYTASLCVGSLLLGNYVDYGFSRRWAMLLGLLFLAGSTILLCLSRTISLFIIARILQGLSAAIVWSAGLALLADTMGDQIGVAMGYTSAAMTVGALISPTIGGVVYNRAGYYAVYYVAFGAIFTDIILRLAVVEKKVASQWARAGQADIERSTDLGPRISTPAHQLDSRTEGTAPDRPDPLAANSTLAAMPESKANKYPQIQILKSRRLLAANFGIAVHSGAILMADTVIPLFAKNVFHWNSIATGLILLPVCIPGFVAPGVGWLSDRYGARLLSAFGFIASVPTMACLRLVDENTTYDKFLLGALLTLLGLTYTFASTPLMAEITYVIQAEEAKQPGIFAAKGVYGAGYGLFTFSFALGGTIGSLISGYLVADFGWKTMTWALAAWMSIGGVVVGLWVGD